MNVINISNLHVNVGDRILLDEVSLGINTGDKVGIIGANGNGKTTLLRIIAGESDDYSGEVIKSRGITMSYLPQTPVFSEGDTVLEYVKAGGHTGEIWDKEGEAKNILNRLGITGYDRIINTLSGGQRKRVALAQVLLHPSDVLIMDEPTNHLDSEMIEWLEGYLKAFRGVLIMVTHDRYFLDSVTNKIVEINKAGLCEYDANYEGFLKLKCQREEMELATERKRESILRNELKWVMRGARARSTKQKSRLERFEEMSSIAKIKADDTIEMESASTRMGKKTIELHDISKSYENNNYIRNFNYIFLKNQKVGIIGKNGCGKSTLLNIIAGGLMPDSGVVTVGDTIKIGYFTQHNDSMNPKLRVIDYIREVAEYIPVKDGRITASQMLEKFLFTPKQQYTLIERLSGGERRRLYLLKILMEAPNVLLLDEPTNDLDIMTLQVLEDYLDSFEGIVITVSHDRYFLDRIADRVLVFESGGNIREYMGGYTDYYNRCGNTGNNFMGETRVVGEEFEKISKKKQEKSEKKKEKPRVDRIRFSYKEQKEYETIEQDIEILETRISELDCEILQAAHDFVKLNELMKLKEEMEVNLEQKMERWMYLSEKAEAIEKQK